jgi:hypothetical protein
MRTQPEFGGSCARIKIAKGDIGDNKEWTLATVSGGSRYLDKTVNVPEGGRKLCLCGQVASSHWYAEVHYFLSRNSILALHQDNYIRRCQKISTGPTMVGFTYAFII